MSLILLHPDDNVLVLSAPVRVGDALTIDGRTVTAPSNIEVGHKLARHALAAGDKILKYGAPIGSMTAPAGPGEHIHMHNMKSDYIASHTRQATGDGGHGS
jgi:(2R)-sulfolactate sulfo-lyase subunit alpha